METGIEEETRTLPSPRVTRACGCSGEQPAMWARDRDETEKERRLCAISLGETKSVNSARQRADGRTGDAVRRKRAGRCRTILGALCSRGLQADYAYLLS